jgi:hypothetical protein
MITDKNELAVWWLNQWDYENGIELEDGKLDIFGLPEYLQDEVRSRQGRPGRGRLWVPDGIEIQDIPWPEKETPLTRHLGKCGGIVFWRRDLPIVKEFPGVVTDMDLVRL